MGCCYPKGRRDNPAPLPYINTEQNMFKDKLNSLIKEGEHLTSKWQDIYNEYPKEIQNEREKAIKEFLNKHDFLIYTDKDGNNPFTRVRWINERFVIEDKLRATMQVETISPNPSPPAASVSPCLKNVPTLEEEEEVFGSVEVPDPAYIIPNRTRG